LQAFEHQFNSKSNSDSKKSPKKAKSPQKRKAAAAANTPQSAYYTIRGILDEIETEYVTSKLLYACSSH